MAKLLTPGGMKPIKVNCPQCQEPFELDISNPKAQCPNCGKAFAGPRLHPTPAADAFQVDKSPGLDALMAAKEKERSLEVDEEQLDKAIALYRRGAGEDEWREAGLDREHWELKFKFMGLDDILARQDALTKDDG